MSDNIRTVSEAIKKPVFLASKYFSLEQAIYKGLRGTGCLDKCQTLGTAYGGWF